MAELVGKATDLVDDVTDPNDERAVPDNVGKRLDALDVEGAADELEAKIAELDALADRLRVGLEHRFQGTVEGVDARRTYCAYCGQAVTKEEIEAALKAVEGHRGGRSEGSWPGFGRSGTRSTGCGRGWRGRWVGSADKAEVLERQYSPSPCASAQCSLACGPSVKVK